MSNHMSAGKRRTRTRSMYKRGGADRIPTSILVEASRTPAGEAAIAARTKWRTAYALHEQGRNTQAKVNAAKTEHDAAEAALDAVIAELMAKKTANAAAKGGRRTRRHRKQRTRRNRK